MNKEKIALGNQILQQIEKLQQMLVAWDEATQFHENYKLKLINDNYEGSFGISLSRKWFEIIKKEEMSNLRYEIEKLEFNLQQI